jgi:hypothetical protein
VLNRDFNDLFCAFNDFEVRYLVVGAYAVTFHSRPRYTKDLDVWVDPEPENAQRVWKALARFGAPIADVSPGDLSSPGMVYQIGVEPNRIDVLTSIAGVDFPSAWEHRCSAAYGSTPIHVLSRSHLITNKRSVGRPQDLLDIEALEAGKE